MKKNNKKLEQGYIFMPYIIKTTTPHVIGLDSKSIDRKIKINKIFDLNKYFPPKYQNKLALNSRYVTINV